MGSVMLRPAQRQTTSKQFIADTDKRIPIVVCCYHGDTSQGAASFFNEQGFDEAYSLDGGYASWASGQ